MGRTLYEKFWQAHAVAAGQGGRTLLYVDRHLLHDGSFHAFEALRRSGRAVRRPETAFATPDHYAPTRRNGAMSWSVVTRTPRPTAPPAR